MRRLFASALLWLALALAPFASSAQVREFAPPTGPALEQEIRDAVNGNSFEVAKTRWHYVTDYLNSVVHKLKPKYKTVFNPFGGVDPSAFAIFDCETVISVGLESFGTVEEIKAQLETVKQIHRSATFMVNNSYIDVQVGGYWSLGTKVGAYFLTFLKHVYEAEVTSLKYLDANNRHVEAMVKFGGKTRKFIYFQTNIGDAEQIRNFLDGYGLPDEIAPELLEVLKKTKIDGVLTKAPMARYMNRTMWDALLNATAKGAVWIKESRSDIEKVAFVEEEVRIQMKGGWPYKDNSVVSVVKFRAATDQEREAVQPKPEPPQKGIKSAIGLIKKMFAAPVEAPAINFAPKLFESELPSSPLCEPYLKNRELYDRENRPSAGGGGPKVRF